jgi:hypothetical protein
MHRSSNGCMRRPGSHDGVRELPRMQCAVIPVPDQACPGLDPGSGITDPESSSSPVIPGLTRNPCAWEQARFEGWKSPSGRCPFPVAEGNCVTVRWCGEQPTANMQSVGRRTQFGRARRRACGFKAKSRPGRQARHRVAIGSWESITLGGQQKSGDGAREV